MIRIERKDLLKGVLGRLRLARFETRPAQSVPGLRAEKRLWARKNRFEMDEPLATITFDRPDKTGLERKVAHLYTLNRDIADVICGKRHLRVHLHGSTCPPIPGGSRLAAKVAEMLKRNLGSHCQCLVDLVMRHFHEN